MVSSRLTPPAPRAPSPADRDLLLTLLNPHREFLRGRGVELPGPGEPVPLDRVLEVLAVAGPAAPPGLADALRALADANPGPPVGGVPPGGAGLAANNLEQFWAALDAQPELAAGSGVWRQILGREFDLAGPFLRLRPGGGDEYEVNRGRLADAVGVALGVARDGEVGPEAGAATHLGRFSPGSGAGYGVFLSFPTPAEDLHVVAAGLVARGQAPLVLLAPTRRWAPRQLDPVLRRTGSLLVPLAAAVFAAGPGRLCPLCPLGAAVAWATGAGGDPPERAGGTAGNVIRRQGEFWLVTYVGRAVALRDSLGVRYLARLIAAKGRGVWAADLRAGARGGPAVEPFRGVEALDGRGFAECRKGERDLLAEVEEARRCGDAARVEFLQGEINALTEYVGAARGLRGRVRRVGDKSTSVRTSVKNAIDLVVRKLLAEHPDLARHLEDSIRTGESVCYDPRPDVHWEL